MKLKLTTEQGKTLIQKNNVSYFEAGFKAGMVMFGNISEAEVRRRFYSSILYPTIVRSCLRDYDSQEDHESGEQAMFENM